MHSTGGKGMTDNKNTNNQACPIASSINIFGGKWKPEILYFINLEPRRFNELKRLIPNITQRMLTQQLRELERDGIIDRKQYLEIPPKVVYSMTDLGNTLIPIFKELENWTTRNINKVEKARAKYNGENS